jgi:hypothetical protein
MRKGRFYLILLAMSFLALVLLKLFGAAREPVHGGRTLSQWVMGFTYSAELARSTPAEREKAIHMMGTNALPFLLKWIRYEPSPLKANFYNLLNSVLKPIKPSWQLSDRNEQLRADGAMFALMVLGWEATAAAKELSDLAGDPNLSTATRTRAANALALVGTGLGWDSKTIMRLDRD